MANLNVLAIMTESKSNILLNTYVGLILAGFLLVPAAAQGATAEVAAWLPWWSEETAVKSAIANMDKLDTVYPFVFEVKSDGSLVNKVNFKDKNWKQLIAKADGSRVDVIPTIAWFNGDEIHQVLSNSKSRKAHIDKIVKMVKKYRFDGVNIDYEARLSETMDDYSLFLKELNTALGKKLLTCTIEARTPPESRWKVVPDKIEYSNDYKAINQYCDGVEIMAYDQQRADLKLNDERKGVPYMPVADVAWVEKVLKLTLKDIDKNKIMLGVPTYGRAWDITVAPEWYRDYKSVASLNQPRILELAEKYQSPIGRTAGGEAVISYFPDDSNWKILNSLPTPAGTPKGFEAAAKALMVATQAKTEIPVRFVTWSDAQAIEDKLSLVKKYNLKGTAIFKVDGEEDRDLWKLF